LRKKRQVKEGSPFEEEYLIDILKEEVKVTSQDKEEVRDIMKALLNFGMIEESTDLHSLIEKLIKAEYTCVGLKTVEQEMLLEKNPSIEEVFADLFNKKKREEDFNKVLVEWADVKFFKH
jgi:hypothetical protein